MLNVASLNLTDGGLILSGNGDYVFDNAVITDTVGVAVLLGGAINLDYAGDITSGAGASATIATVGHGGTASFHDGTIDITGGDGLQFLDADGTYSFTGTTAIHGGTAGINVANGSSGGFFFGAGTSATDGTIANFVLQDSDASVTYLGSLSQSLNADNFVVAGQTGGVIDFTQATISASAGSGVLFIDADGNNMLGDVQLSGGAGIAVTSGSDGSISFDNVDITGLGANQTAVDLTGALGNVTFLTLDIAGTSATGSKGIDLTGSTTAANIVINESSSITGVGIGVDLTNAAITGSFRFGDGSSVDADGAASLISASVPIEITGLNGGVGTYNFADVESRWRHRRPVTSATTYFVAAGATGAGTMADPRQPLRRGGIGRADHHIAQRSDGRAGCARCRGRRRQLRSHRWPVAARLPERRHAYAAGRRPREPDPVRDYPRADRQSVRRLGRACAHALGRGQRAQSRIEHAGRRHPCRCAERSRHRRQRSRQRHDPQQQCQRQPKRDCRRGRCRQRQRGVEQSSPRLEQDGGAALTLNGNGAGTLTITALDGITIAGGNGETAGVMGTNVVFDADLTTAGYQAVTGTLQIGTAAARIGGIGVYLDAAEGATNFTLDTATDGGSGLYAAGGAGGLQFGIAGGTIDTINAGGADLGLYLHDLSASVTPRFAGLFGHRHRDIDPERHRDRRGRTGARRHRPDSGGRRGGGDQHDRQCNRHLRLRRGLDDRHDDKPRRDRARQYRREHFQLCGQYQLCRDRRGSRRHRRP